MEVTTTLLRVRRRLQVSTEIRDQVWASWPFNVRFAQASGFACFFEGIRCIVGFKGHHKASIRAQVSWFWSEPSWQPQKRQAPKPKKENKNISHREKNIFPENRQARCASPSFTPGLGPAGTPPSPCGWWCFSSRWGQ